MNAPEATKCISLISEIFPQSGMTQAETDLIAGDLMKFDYQCAIDAIKEHRLESSFNRPKYDTIKNKIKDKMSAKRAGPSVFKSHSEILAEQMQCSPIEATLRYWRGQWFAYAKQAQRNEATIRQSVPPGPLLDAAISRWRIQRDGAERKCRTGCRSGLIDCRIPVVDSERWAAIIFAAPHDFKLTLEDFRENGTDLTPPATENPREELEGTLPVFAEGVSVPEF